MKTLRWLLAACGLAGAAAVNVRHPFLSVPEAQAHNTTNVFIQHEGASRAVGRGGVAAPVPEDITTVKHKKSPGAGYVKGSPLYIRQEESNASSVGEAAAAPPARAENDTRSAGFWWAFFAVAIALSCLALALYFSQKLAKSEKAASPAPYQSGSPGAGLPPPSSGGLQPPPSVGSFRGHGPMGATSAPPPFGATMPATTGSLRNLPPFGALTSYDAGRSPVPPGIPSPTHSASMLGGEPGAAQSVPPWMPGTRSSSPSPTRAASSHSPTR